MATNTLSFIDELQGASYSSLSATNFKIGIIDPDDAQLSTSQISSLQATGKSLIAYLSIGEAENYRSYWQSSWNSSPPSFLMGQNPDWPGDYNVKFWDPNWQKIVINEAVSMAKAGYHGIMLDVVDAYTVPAVAAADGGVNNARAAMESFVEAISAATKAVNPSFKIIQNNALDMLTTNPDDPTSATNTNYLSHIDGVLAEDTFYNSDNSTTTWGSYNQQYLQHAVSAGKTVLSIDYPSNAATQASYIQKATAAGYVPYAADESLDSNIPAANSAVPGLLHSTALNSLLSGAASTVSSVVSGATSTVTGTTSTASTTHATTPVTTTTHASTPAVTTSTAGIDQAFAASHHVVNAANGATTLEGTVNNMEFVFGSNYQGNATVKYFATASGDVLDLSPSIYSSAAQALQHVTYSGHNAIVNLGSHGSITIVAAGHNSLTAADFHIG